MENGNLVKIVSKTGKMYAFDALTNNIYLIEEKNDFDSLCMADLGHDNDHRDISINRVDIKKSVLSNAKTLILEITEDCNMRCTYCVFDENYQLERNHTLKHMSLDMAFSAVSDFYKRTNKEEAYVVFYGGEPLLAFDKIKSIVDYGNKISDNRIRFSLTTNGLALAGEKISFLIKNNFLVTVSLDGDKETHDTSRITKTGKGTFDAITNNLKVIASTEKEFFDNNILINCVISDQNKVNDINKFFANTFFNDGQVRFSHAIQDSVAIGEHITSKISLETVRRTLKERHLPVEKEYFDSIVKKIEFRNLDGDAQDGKKFCIPFANRTFVRTDGKIQFCERIGEYKMIDSFSENEIALSKDILGDFLAFKEGSCSNCFAYNFCEMCPASFIKNEQFDTYIAESKCSQYKKSVKLALQIYVDKMEDLGVSVY